MPRVYQFLSCLGLVRLLRVCPLLLALISSAAGTSVVIHVGDKHITIAADDLATRTFAPDPGPYSACKIVPFRKAAFAVAGNIDYRRDDPADRLPDWDARADAHQAFARHPMDLHSAAREWAARAARHYSSFLAVQPARVRALALTNAQHVLVLGTFAGWNDRQQSAVIFEWIYLDLSSRPTIKTRSFVLPSRALPYTTNATTQELIEGDSFRRTELLSNWQLASVNFPSPERNWRWLEFLIQNTSDYDRTVGREVNVLDLTPDGSASWLQNYSCH